MATIDEENLQTWLVFREAYTERVTEALEAYIDITRSDAQAMVEAAGESALRGFWLRWLSPEDAAAKLLEQEPV